MALDGPTRTPTALLARALWVCLLVLAATLTTASAASADRAFSSRFSTNQPGNITIAANTLMSCPSSDSACVSARNAPPQTTTNNASLTNDNYFEHYVNTDPSDNNFDSSSADLTVPPGARVLFAGLYWSGNLATASPPINSALKDHVKLKPPGAPAYTSVTASQVDTTGPSGQSWYQGFADVTAQVTAAGSGSYTVANVQAGTGTGNAYAGWALVVAYADDTQPQRNLTVFDGFVGVSSNTSAAVPVSGFLTPASGPVNTDLGFVGWEGDRGIVGDSASITDTTAGHPATKMSLTDAANPVDNFFNSSISNHGAEVTTRSPNYSNTLGIDADILGANGRLGNSATSARIDLTTSGDVFAPGVVTFATQLYSPHLQQTKTVTDSRGGTTVQQGDTLSYEIAGTNTGSDAATNVSVSDPIPANTTYQDGSASTTPGTVSFDPSANGTVTANLGTVAPGASYDVKFNVTVNSNLPDQTVIDNTATTSFTRQTLQTQDSTSSSASTTVSSPDLAIAKSHTGSVVSGADVTYRLAVSNVGPAPTQGTITVSDAPGSGLTFESISSDDGSFSCDPATPTCTSSTPLAPGAASNITVVARVAPGQTGTVLNGATVSGGGDANAANNSATDSATPTQSADLSVTKELLTANKTANPTAGNPVHYKVTVTNHGPSTATGVSATDTITGAHDPSASGCTSPSTGQLSCAVGTLAVGQTAVIFVDATVDGDTKTVTNSASAQANESDPDPSNNSASVSSSVNAPDLSITKTHTGSVVSGTDVTYHLTVSNAGSAPTQEQGTITVTDSPGSGLTATSITSDDASFSCDLATLTCTRTTTLAVGGTAGVTVVAHLDQAFTGTVNNTATVAGGGDTNATNNSATDSATAAQNADLSLTKTVDHATIVVGETVTYSLLVTNHGPSQASNLHVQDNIPGHLQYASDDDECTVAAQLLTCRVGLLDAGATRTIHVRAHAPPASAGTTNDNSATVSSDTPDSRSNNNTGSATVTVGGTELVVHKLLLTTNPTAGGPVRYRVTVTNNGPSGATGVTVTDTMTGGHDLSAPGCTATTTPRQLSCVVGALAAGQTVTLVIDAIVDQNATTVANTATASGNEPNSNPSSGAATVSTTVTPAPTPAAPKPSPTPTTSVQSVSVTSTRTASQLALQCTNKKLTLTDVLQSGGRVLLSGAADPSLVGHKVVIVFRRRPVASAIVGTDGLFSTTAALPPAAIRNTNLARYIAQSGRLRSLAMKLTRRLILNPPTSAGGKVTLTGQVVPPLEQPRATVFVLQTASCTQTITVARFKPSPDGHFSITINAPAHQVAALYRLQTRVRDSSGGRTGFDTYSLSLPVKLG